MSHLLHLGADAAYEPDGQNCVLGHRVDEPQRPLGFARGY